MTKWLYRSAFFALAGVLSAFGSPGQVQADSIADGGLIAPGLNVVCPSGAIPCTSNVTYSLLGTADATGSIEIAGGTASIDLFIASASFDDQVFFQNVSYSASIGVLDLGGGSYTTLIPDTSAAVSGEIAVAGGPFVAFSHEDVVATNLVCAGGQCGVTFGPSGFTGNDGVYDYVHTFNVTVPEPGLLVLLGLGLAAVAARRAR